MSSDKDVNTSPRETGKQLEQSAGTGMHNFPFKSEKHKSGAPPGTAAVLTCFYKHGSCSRARMTIAGGRTYPKVSVQNQTYCSGLMFISLLHPRIDGKKNTWRW